MPGPVLFVLLLAAILGVPAVTHSFWFTVGAVALVALANPVVRSIRKDRYFASEHFQQLKAEVSALISEHNDVVQYVDEIRTRGSFELGASSTGQHAHLAAFENTSNWNYRRDRNVAEYAPRIHNASLQVVRNASADPLKYLMKYFSIKPDIDTLADVQRVAADIFRLETAIANVTGREGEIASRIAPPRFILKHFHKEFWDQLGAELSPIAVPYPQYKFEYTSAGGNSGQATTIDLNTPTLEALAEALAERIRWTKSVAGQRALMTTRLRTWVKERDGHMCVQCGVSVAHEPHLLLEVDHILPVSKGGLSVPENLQTLCWRCNRTKGAKV